MDITTRDATEADLPVIVSLTQELIDGMAHSENIDDEEDAISEMSTSFKEESSNIINFNKSGINIKKVGG